VFDWNSRKNNGRIAGAIMSNIEKKLIEYALNSEDPKINYEIAMEYDSLNQVASAISHYIRCAERTDNKLLAYECMLRGGLAIRRLGSRIYTEKSFFQNAVNILPDRPEAYAFLSDILSEKGEIHHAYTYCCIGEMCAQKDHLPLLNSIKQYGGIFELKIKKIIYAKKCGLKEEDTYLQTIENNLKNCPTIYYISSEKFKDRQEKIEFFFKTFKINYIPIIATKKSDEELKYVYAPGCVEVKQAIYTTVTHLKAIEFWLNSTNEEYGLFFEDDISFETVEYWNFNINNFIKNLPEDWQAVQLQIVSSDVNAFDIKTIKERNWDDWAVGAYLIKRTYAEQILKNHKKENYYNLILPEPYSNVQPLIENIIYSFGKVYKFPLFVENLSIPSTFIENQYYIETCELEYKNGMAQKLNHHFSYEKVMNLWKTNSFCYTPQ